jgi:hypothetical protein
MKRRILVSIGLAVLLTQAFGFSQTGRPSTPPDLQGIDECYSHAFRAA